MNNFSETLISIAPTIATIFFFLVFCYIVFSLFKKGAKEKFNKLSKIPLKDNDR
jgi:cbb3-type cytochrome oxidase subunit 3